MALLNSFTFDYAIRLRVARRDLRPYQLSVAAVPYCDAVVCLNPIGSVSFGGAADWIYEDKQRWSMFSAAGATIARAHGLTPDDFAYILTTFPVFARERPEFYAYLQERVREWEMATRAGRAYGPAVEVERFVQATEAPPKGEDAE